jgi:hypothetical protein
MKLPFSLETKDHIITLIDRTSSQKEDSSSTQRSLELFTEYCAADLQNLQNWQDSFILKD